MNAFRVTLAVLGLVALAACDIPTEAPILEQRWVLPVENTTISVAELLPSGVTESGNSFAVSVGAFSTNQTLGSLCSACGVLEGLTAPVPAFQGNLTVSQTLPSDVIAATLTSGSVAVAVQNLLSFDVLAGGGTVTLTLTDGPGGRPLGQTVISGSMPPGSVTNRTLTLAPGAIGRTVVAVAVVNSPGGQVTTIDNAGRIVVTATPSAILVSSATVDVSGQTVSFDPVDLDVEDIDSEIADRVVNGSLLLDVTNPFGVAVDAQVIITYPGGQIVKTLNIAGTPTSAATLSYSGDEFRTFLGRPGVLLTGSGTVSSAAPVITVTPGQTAVIDGQIDLTLRIGG